MSAHLKSLLPHAALSVQFRSRSELRWKGSWVASEIQNPQGLPEKQEDGDFHFGLPLVQSPKERIAREM